MKRLSLENLQAIAKENGGECLSENYTHSSHKIKWRCKKGHTWESAARNIINSGSWCPYCAGRRHNLEEMISIAESRGGKCAAEKYNGMQSKLKWICAHGHEWKATPASILISGSWCPECSAGLGERLARSAIEQIMGIRFPKARPKWLLSRRGTQLELDGYCEDLGVAFEHQGEQHFTEIAYFARKSIFSQRLEDDQTKRELCIANGVTLIEIPEIGRRLILKNLPTFIEKQLELAGIKIPHPGISPDFTSAYASSSAKDTLEQLYKLSAELGGECLEQQYMGSRERHRFRCSEGHEWKTPAESILRGKWCPRCSAKKKADKVRNCIDKIQDAARQKGGHLISEEYLSADQRLEWECATGHRWHAPYNSIRSGTWCPICARRDISEFGVIAHNRGGELISVEYLGMANPLEWQCRLGHRWHARPINVINGTWCPYCAKNRKLTIDDMHQIAIERGGFCISQHYKNARSKLRWRCSQGHEWDATPYSIKTGTWCPVCSKKKS